jgi:hypothetical protein
MLKMSQPAKKNFWRKIPKSTPMEPHFLVRVLGGALLAIASAVVWIVVSWLQSVGYFVLNLERAKWVLFGCAFAFLLGILILPQVWGWLLGIRALIKTWGGRIMAFGMAAAIGGVFGVTVWAIIEWTLKPLPAKTGGVEVKESLTGEQPPPTPLVNDHKEPSKNHKAAKGAQEPQAETGSVQLPAKQPRASDGVDAYKDFTPEQVAKWAEDAADKLEETAKDVMSKYNYANPQERGGGDWRFTKNYVDCCEEYVVGLRREILRRLGPKGVDARERSAWDLFTMETVNANMTMPRDKSPRFALEYAPHLRRLAKKLRHTVTTRLPKKGVPITIQYPVAPMFKDANFGKVFVIGPVEPINRGYIVVEFNKQPMGISAAGAGVSSIHSAIEVDDQPEVSSILARYLEPHYVVKIGKQKVSNDAPLLIQVAYRDGDITAIATWYDE